MLFLRTYLDYRLHTRFWQHVTPLDDNIYCDLLAVAVTQQADQSYRVADSCRKETATCFLPEFLHERRTKLQAISTYLAAHPNVIKEQPRVEQLLRAVQRDPRSALGQSSCWPLGDLIILLQAPSACAVWSLGADFAALTTALGLPLFAP